MKITKKSKPIEVAQWVLSTGDLPLALDILIASGYTRRAAERELLPS